MTFKQIIHHHYLHLVQANISRLQMVLADLKESGANETKSTAGDKHETALAMLQLEQEKVRNQLAEAQQQLSILNQIQPEKTHTIIGIGSLVKTDKGYLYISIAAGKSEVSGKKIIAISPASPLGQQLLKKKAGQAATTNNTTLLVESVE